LHPVHVAAVLTAKSKDSEHHLVDVYLADAEGREAMWARCIRPEVGVNRPRAWVRISSRTLGLDRGRAP
jgi:hypothetical protein